MKEVIELVPAPLRTLKASGAVSKGSSTKSAKTTCLICLEPGFGAYNFANEALAELLLLNRVG